MAIIKERILNTTTKFKNYCKNILLPNINEKKLYGKIKERILNLIKKSVWRTDVYKRQLSHPLCMLLYALLPFGIWLAVFLGLLPPCCLLYTSRCV